MTRPLLATILLGAASVSTGLSEVHEKSMDPYAALSPDASEPESATEALRFESTQTWDEFFKTELLAKGPRNLSSWKTHIELPSPPDNTSPRTRAELDYLIEQRKKRNPESQKAIEEERGTGGFRFGQQTLADLQQEGEHLAKLIDYTYWQTAPIVMYFKKKFNRVRPSFLSAEIEPTLPNPDHPAYPSGHSTLSHVYARVLGEIFPDERKSFLDSARSIARNREIAGLHYPSDSEAGRLLSIQVFQLLQENEQFIELLEVVKAELKGSE